MIEALRKAGFVGIEASADGVIYARAGADLPEFTATPDGAGWRFAVQWPLRAGEAQRADWADLHPYAPLDVDLGETRMQFWGDAEALNQWAALMRDMLASCIAWRRATRQMDEGM